MARPKSCVQIEILGVDGVEANAMIPDAGAGQQWEINSKLSGGALESSTDNRRLSDNARGKSDRPEMWYGRFTGAL